MSRRAIVALLATVFVFTASLVHSAFACSAAGHVAPSAAHRHCQDGQSSPPCCRESASALANDRADRVASGARIAPRLLATPAMPNVPLRIATLERVTATAASPSRSEPVPQHLRNRSLLL